MAVPKIYRWKGSESPSENASIVGNEVARLMSECEERKETLDPGMVVSVAEDPANPLHSRFCWDNTKAAHLYRLIQARMLLERIEVSTQARKSDPPKWLPVVISPKQGEGYKSTVVALRNKKDSELILETCLREWRYWHQKWATLKDLSPFRKRIERLDADFKALPPTPPA